MVDKQALIRAWSRATDVPPYRGRPASLHGDLLPSNILVRDGRLVAVIDWGGLTVGDPAVDVIPAWTILTQRARASFLEEVDADDDVRARASGWALTQAVVALWYYRPRGHSLAGIAHRTLEQVAADARVR